MPTIPQYGGQQVQTATVQGPRAQELPSSAFPGAQLAQGVQQLAQGVQQYNDRVDQTTAEEALVNFEREKNRIFFDPDNGYYKSQGRDAYDKAPSVMEQLNELKRNYSSKLESQQARQMFDQVATKHITSSEVDVMRHASKGYEAWEIATAESVVENTIENVSLNWSDEERINVQLELGVQQITDVARMKGIEGVALNEQIETYRSTAISGAVESALNEGSASAEKFLETYGRYLEGPDKKKVDKLISVKKAAERKQYIAQQAVLIAGKAVDQSDGDRVSVMEVIDAIDDPEVQSAARREAVYQLNQLDKIKQQQQLDAFKMADDFIRSGRSPGEFVSLYKDQWEAMTPKQRATIEKGRTAEMDWNLWYKVSMYSDKELAGMNADEVSNVATYLDESHRNKFISMVRAARGEGSDSDKRDTQVGRTRASQVTTMMERLIGKNKGKWTTDNKAQADVFYGVLDSEVASREAELGRPLNSEEFTQVVNSYTRKAVIERSFLPDSEITIADIPTEDLTILRNHLKMNGVPVNTDTLLRAYIQAR